jgi:tetratricopeptide (TPR) repeat protein
MVRRNGRPFWLPFAAVAAIVALASPVFAQGNSVKGVVRDDKGQPVEGATIQITMADTGRKFQTKSDRRGAYIQIGLASGSYEVTATKDKLVSAPAKATVRAGGPAEIDLVIGVSAAAASADAAARGAALKSLFEEGNTLSQAGKHDEAIVKFNEGIKINPNCFSCYNAVGNAYMLKKDYPQAEAALQKSVELKADDAEVYNLLANLYNAQRKFTEAAAASKKATELSASSAGGGAGNPDVTYNQGVILFNAGKVGEAKPLFEQVLKSNPNHAEAHYMLGMSIVGENPAAAVSEFETYLKLSPSGPNAPMAKQFVDALKK